LFHTDSSSFPARLVQVVFHRESSLGTPKCSILFLDGVIGFNDAITLSRVLARPLGMCLEIVGILEG
jgi:hypothetical protein